MSLKQKNPVMYYYLKHGEAGTVKEISEATGMSEYRVRKFVNQDFAPVFHTWKYVEIYSKDYPWYSPGSRKVSAYLPTMADLREMVLSKAGFEEVEE